MYYLVKVNTCLKNIFVPKFDKKLILVSMGMLHCRNVSPSFTGVVESEEEVFVRWLLLLWLSKEEDPGGVISSIKQGVVAVHHVVCVPQIPAWS